MIELYIVRNAETELATTAEGHSKAGLVREKDDIGHRYELQINEGRTAQLSNLNSQEHEEVTHDPERRQGRNDNIGENIDPNTKDSGVLQAGNFSHT